MEIGTGLALFGAAKLIEKLLGPTADYIGKGIRTWAEKCVNNIREIFSVATVRIDDIYLNPDDIFKNLFIRRMFEERKWNDIFYYAFYIERDTIESGFWWLWWLEFYRTNLFIVAFLESTANLPSEVKIRS